VLKIDKSFIDDISNLQDDGGLIAATIIDGAYSGL
jgi:sensor c-di-GMP phosphodiesterase-like protein